MGPKNGWSAGQRVTANSLEHRRPIVHYVRHDMQGGAVPGNQLAVMPDFLGVLNRHELSFDSKMVPRSRWVLLLEASLKISALSPVRDWGKPQSQAIILDGHRAQMPFGTATQVIMASGTRVTF